MCQAPFLCPISKISFCLIRKWEVLPLCTHVHAHTHGHIDTQTHTYVASSGTSKGISKMASFFLVLFLTGAASQKGFKTNRNRDSIEKIRKLSSVMSSNTRKLAVLILRGSIRVQVNKYGTYKKPLKMLEE